MANRAASSSTGSVWRAGGGERRAHRGLLIAVILAVDVAVGTAAAAPQGQGVVAFANSGAAAAQTDFLTALALLHNFQYAEAEEAFRRAEKADPDFAMAYWGEAMTHNHAVWQEQDLGAARAALGRLGASAAARAAKAGSARERAYLHAVEVLYGEGDKYERDRRYALVMEQLHERYPDDVDASCFYALALLGTAHGGRDLPTYMRAAALMEEAFESHPRHPGAAHYLIHSVDDSVHAPLGLRAARAYAQIAPDSPHAQHMTSHIYLALGMWDDVVAANEAATRVFETRRRGRGAALAPVGCAHSLTWLAYGYLQQGRFADARRLVEACGTEMRERPMTASGADLLDADNSSAGSFSAMRSRYLIDTGERSGPVSRLSVQVAGVVVAELARDFADGYGAARAGELDAARAGLGRLRDSATRLLAAAAVAGIPAENPLRRVPGIEQDELEGLLRLREGDEPGGLTRLSAAAAAEKAIPMEFGPPSLDKPANELLGEVLLERGRPQQARAAFEAAQVLAPGRGQSLIGLARCADLLHDPELARSVESRLARVHLREALAGAAAR